MSYFSEYPITKGWCKRERKILSNIEPPKFIELQIKSVYRRNYEPQRSIPLTSAHEYLGLVGIREEDFI